MRGHDVAVAERYEPPSLRDLGTLTEITGSSTAIVLNMGSNHGLTSYGHSVGSHTAPDTGHHSSSSTSSSGSSSSSSSSGSNSSSSSSSGSSHGSSSGSSSNNSGSGGHGSGAHNSGG